MSIWTLELGHVRQVLEGCHRVGLELLDQALALLLRGHDDDPVGVDPCCRTRLVADLVGEFELLSILQHRDALPHEGDDLVEVLVDRAPDVLRQGPLEEPSTVSCEAVAACTVVMRPCLMPNFSLMVLTRGARPLVVHEAHETTAIDVS